MATLELYLKGKLFQTHTFWWPEFECQAWEDRAAIREYILKQQTTWMIVTYIRAILKCNYQIGFVLVVKMKETANHVDGEEIKGIATAGEDTRISDLCIQWACEDQEEEE